MPKVEDPARISNYDVVAAPDWATVRTLRNCLPPRPPFPALLQGESAVLPS